MNIAGLILAAGESKRMGTPKALLDLRGETFLNRLIRVFAASCDPVVVVVGWAWAWRVRWASVIGRSARVCTYRSS